jgi:hypothetical protein
VTGSEGVTGPQGVTGPVQLFAGTGITIVSSSAGTTLSTVYSTPNNSVALGFDAGLTGQSRGVAIGDYAGGASQFGSPQEEGAVAIGFEAGFGGQGVGAIAIGRSAAARGQKQPAGSIVIGSNVFDNTTGLTANACYISPIRSLSGNTTNAPVQLFYNPATGELTIA